VLRDRDELVEGRRQLLLPRAFEPLPQHRHERRLRAAVDEDDEAEAEALLVGAVQLLELRRLVGPLLGGGTIREPLGADRRVGVQHLLLLLVGEARCNLARAAERISSWARPSTK